MRRVALLSTWNEMCGIAHYSYFLKHAIDAYVDITVIPIPRDIVTGAETRAEIAAADQFMEGIAEAVRDFDVVIMQFEPGLYGRGVRQSLSRVMRILKQCRDFVIAFHYYPREQHMRWRDIFSSLRPRHILHNLNSVVAAQWRETQWKRFYKALLDHSKKYNVTAITHTRRDARALSLKLPGIDVLDHPLSYMDEAYIDKLDELAAASELRGYLPQQNPEARYIGVFGFYSAYKGFDTAIRALKNLPDKYELLMFSGVHESSIGTSHDAASYLKSLVQLVEKEDLIDRVHFIGSVGDDDMLLGMMLCDAVVIPYKNTFHSASGPASQAIELGRPTYCTRTKQFVELKKYFPNHFEFFDVENNLELSAKILRNEGRGKDRNVNGLRFVEFETKHGRQKIQDTVANYLRALGAPRELAPNKEMAKEIESKS